MNASLILYIKDTKAPPNNLEDGCTHSYPRWKKGASKAVAVYVPWITLSTRIVPFDNHYHAAQIYTGAQIVHASSLQLHVRNKFGQSFYGMCWASKITTRKFSRYTRNPIHRGHRWCFAPQSVRISYYSVVSLLGSYIMALICLLKSGSLPFSVALAAVSAVARSKQR